MAEVGLVVGEAEVASLNSTVHLPWDSWEELHCGGGVWGGGGEGEGGRGRKGEGEREGRERGGEGREGEGREDTIAIKYLTRRLSDDMHVTCT